MNLRLFVVLFFGGSLLCFSAKTLAAIPVSQSVVQQISAQLNDGELRQRAQSITVKVFANQNSGSGTLLNKKGQIYTVLTNAHVLIPGHPFRIQTSDGQQHSAEVVKEVNWKGTDLAILQFRSTIAYQVASLEDSSALAVSEPIFAAGFPLDQKTMAFTNGKIALLPPKALKEGYQIGYTNNVQQGMSGGPLLNREGKVIGINGITAYPILNSTYVFSDGSIPDSAQIEKMRRASWGIPIRAVTQLAPQFTSAEVDRKKPGKVISSESYYKQGLTQLVEDEYDKAIKSFSKVIELNPNSAEAFLGRGLAYASLDNDDFSKAMQDFNRALEINPDFAEAYALRALYPIFRITDADAESSHQTNAKDYIQWLEDLERALKLNPTLAYVYMGRAYVHYLKQDLIGFLEDASRSVNLSLQQKNVNGVQDLSLSKVLQKKYNQTILDSLQHGRDSTARATAKKITVRIDGASSNGSGIIIAKQGRIYYVLTCWHVVKDAINYKIITPKGKSYSVGYKEIKAYKEADLAVIKFNSQEDYQVAVLADYSIPEGESAFVSVTGWAGKQIDSPEPQLRSTIGFIFSPFYGALLGQNSSFAADFLGSNLLSDSAGVEMVYTNFTEGGMSGGPVLDTRGRVIGIHRRVEAEVFNSQASGDINFVQQGFSLGVPIRALLGSITRLNIERKWLTIETSPPPSEDEEDTSVALSFLIQSVADSSKSSNKVSFWLNQGNQLLRLFRFNEAISAFNKAKDLQPGSYQAWQGIGLSLFFSGKAEEALEAFNQVVKIEPSFYSAWYWRSLALFSLNKADDGFLSFNKSVELQLKAGGQPPAITTVVQISMLIALRKTQDLNEATERLAKATSPEAAYTLRGLIYILSKDFDGAFNDFNYLIKLKPNSDTAYTGRGLARVGKMDYQGANEDCTYAIKLNYKQDSAYLVRGIAKHASGDQSGAVEDFSRAVELNQKSTEAYYRRGLVLSGLSKEREAVEDFTRAITLDSKKADAYRERGVALVGLKAFDEAIKDLDYAIKLNPKDAEAYAGRSLASLGKNDKKKAMEDIAKALEIAPENPDIYSVRALIQIGFKERNAAIADLQKAAELYHSQGNTAKYQQTTSTIQKLLEEPSSASRTPKPDTPKPDQEGVNLAQEAAQLAQSQKYELAVQKAELAAQLAPKNPEVWSLLGGLYLQTNDVDKGIKAFQQALELDPKNAAVLFGLGSAYFQKGQYTTAIESLKLGLKVKPNVPGALFDLGNAYLVLGRYSDALDQYNHAITQDKNFWPAISNIGLIKYEKGDVAEALRHWKIAISIDKKAAEPQMASAVAYYTRGEREQGITLGVAAIEIDGRFGDLKFLKENLWGEHLLADTKKFLEIPQIKAVIDQASKRQSPSQ